jgi:Lar family restriction alleviation protein
MTNEELKPCPFCGGKAEMVSDFDDEHYVYCTGCKGGWKTMETPEEAAEAWNRRVEA